MPMMACKHHIAVGKVQTFSRKEMSVATGVFQPLGQFPRKFPRSIFTFNALQESLSRSTSTWFAFFPATISGLLPVMSTQFLPVMDCSQRVVTANVLPTQDLALGLPFPKAGSGLGL
jgi:hypothetical protein